jgi:ankyrin repeat protein
MKFYLPVFLLLALACGKEAEINQESNKVPEIEKTKSEISFEALREITEAVEKNAPEKLKSALFHYSDFDLNRLMVDGETYLTKAIKLDYRDVRDVLIQHGASIEHTNILEQTPVMVSVLYERESTLRVLLDLNAKLNQQDLKGNTALHQAILAENDDMALLLVKQGANIDLVNKDFKSPYQLAQNSHIPKTLELMETILHIERGAPDIASFRNVLIQGDIRTLNTMLTRHPKIVRDYESLNPLALLVDSKDENTALRSAELLLSYQANVNGPLDAQETPLIRATLKGKKGFARLYLESKANTQLLDKEGKSPLIHAVLNNDPELVDLLLSYSAVEKYTFRKDGKKITYSACKTVSEVRERLNEELEKKKNSQIKKSLDCGPLSWLF